MGTPCPKCQGKLLAGKKMVRCENYKREKLPNQEWVNTGSCDFRIHFSHMYFGNFQVQDIVKMVGGETIKNKKGDAAKLDLANQYFIHIDYKEPKEVEI